jgi:phenylpyruvate tautomerase PptA (4-oxalocrotonate tautomerase family)
MPYYEINHAVILTESQKDDLAKAITKLHSERFMTPRLIVNVKYTDISNMTFYIAGKRRTKSHILAHVRTGASRSNKDFNALCADLFTAWNEIVPLPKIKRSAPDEDRSLHGVFVLGDLVAGMEAGFTVPEAGKDGEWLAENMPAFRARAENGEEDFVDLVKEVEERGMLKGQKSEAQKLEEIMGWGDSA